MSDENLRAHVVASGRVQGVFFRSNTKSKAEELSVKGWVRNLPNGSLEAVFEGGQKEVEEMVYWVRKGGPIFASVEGMEVTWEEYKGEFNNFEIKR